MDCSMYLMLPTYLSSPQSLSLSVAPFSSLPLAPIQHYTLYLLGTDCCHHSQSYLSPVIKLMTWTCN